MRKAFFVNSRANNFLYSFDKHPLVNKLCRNANIQAIKCRYFESIFMTNHFYTEICRISAK